MNIDYIKLQESEWNTLFNIETKSDEILIVQIAELVIDEINYESGKLIFEKPKREWAMFWNEKKEDWENHIDTDSPIGNKITAFNAKIVGDTISISLGGNHSLGFSRWGFYVDRMKFQPKEN
jgi:hypothetical protein|tara:strand:- start:2079 stop:2444 length:366 start_codon:yes stop_codon:yes gene_type:complete